MTPARAEAQDGATPDRDARDPGAAALMPDPGAAALTPDPGAAALASGAGTFVVGFVAGATITGAAGENATVARIGWLTIASSFVAAPIVGHAVGGETSRGFTCAIVPSAALTVTAYTLGVEPGGVQHGTLRKQQVLWGAFTVGLVSAIFGVIDAARAGERAQPKWWIAPQGLGI